MFLCDSFCILPSEEILGNLIKSKDDVFHAGLLLGLGGKPDFLNFVSPTWMLNRDPDPDIEATSWRLSLRACLIRTEVLRQLGGPLAGFDDLDAAGLELGLRYIRHGVFMRHCPQLVQHNRVNHNPPMTHTDQFRIIAASYGKKWLYWAGMRAILNKRVGIYDVINGINRAKNFVRQTPAQPYRRPESATGDFIIPPNVTVLIPTINRYPYLKTVLAQLRSQTIKPSEILIIDQTPLNNRDDHLREEFQDLPIQWIDLETAGQCRSRNQGLLTAQGDYILFIDDDDEIPADLIEKHLRNLQNNRSNVSNGVAFEKGMPRLPFDFTFTQVSSVFPTNNSLIKKIILTKTGLFDLAYDRGQRADHDLGMRIYLTGEKMVLNPGISVIHHHAPQGGLREHKARVITRTASRKSIWLRVVPSISDIYLAKRYYSENQVKEMLWISILGTFSHDGTINKKILKIIISSFSLPQTLWKLRGNVKMAKKLLGEYPQIPLLPDE